MQDRLVNHATLRNWWVLIFCRERNRSLHSKPFYYEIVGVGGRGAGMSRSPKKILPQFGQKVGRGVRTPGSLPWIRHRRGSEMNVVKLKCVVCDRMRKESNMNSHFLNHRSWIKSRCVIRWFSLWKKKRLMVSAKCFFTMKRRVDCFPLILDK